MTVLDSIDPGRMASTWWWRKFHKSVRVGFSVIHSDDQQHRIAIGTALIAYGLRKRRRGPKLIYKTSIDVDEGVTIRVLRGRRPIAETAPIR